MKRKLTTAPGVNLTFKVPLEKITHDRFGTIDMQPACNPLLSISIDGVTLGSRYEAVQVGGTWYRVATVEEQQRFESLWK
mgnify:CR=1 FL=1